PSTHAFAIAMQPGVEVLRNCGSVAGAPGSAVRAAPSRVPQRWRAWRGSPEQRAIRRALRRTPTKPPENRAFRRVRRLARRESPGNRAFGRSREPPETERSGARMRTRRRPGASTEPLEIGRPERSPRPLGTECFGFRLTRSPRRPLLRAHMGPSTLPVVEFDARLEIGCHPRAGADLLDAADS